MTFIAIIHLFVDIFFDFSTSHINRLFLYIYFMMFSVFFCSNHHRISVLQYRTYFYFISTQVHLYISIYYFIFHSSPCKICLGITYIYLFIYFFQSHQVTNNISTIQFISKLKHIYIHTHTIILLLFFSYFSSNIILYQQGKLSSCNIYGFMTWYINLYAIKEF